LKRLANSSEPSRCRAISPCLQPSGHDLAHIGCSITLVQCMREAGSFHPQKRPEPLASCRFTSGTRNSIERAKELEAWRAENPGNKYPIYFAPQPALMTAIGRKQRPAG
jgi:hypothetical protein